MPVQPVAAVRCLLSLVAVAMAAGSVMTNSDLVVLAHEGGTYGNGHHQQLALVTLTLQMSKTGERGMA